MFMFNLGFVSFNNNNEHLDHTSHKVICLPDLEHLESFIDENCGLSKESYYILCNGKKVDSSDKVLFNNGIMHVVPRTLGGKGGFGSMLRAIGAQIEKTTNREACRDLSGRRLRDINEEQRLKNWISQQAEREREAEERKRKKIERLCQEPKHDFKDDKYDESRSVMLEKMNSSVEVGFKASSSGSQLQFKRKHVEDKCSKNTDVKRKKKKKLWVDAEEGISSSTDNSDNEVDSKQCI